MSTSYETELHVAKAIAKQAGEIMLQYFNLPEKVTIKADGSPVTIADTTINHMVIEELAKHFDDGVVGEEESTAEYGMGRRWFCDPIDGTKSYIWGIPVAMFSLGLVVDGVPVLGVTYNPFTGKLYEAVTGQGSFCNGEPITVSTLDLAKGNVLVSRSVQTFVTNPPVYAQELAQQKVSMVTINGAVFDCSLVATGYAVGYIEEHLRAHDLAAAQVIVQEAGGRVTGYDGSILDYSKPFKGGVVSNGVVHEMLLGITTK